MGALGESVASGNDPSRSLEIVLRWGGRDRALPIGAADGDADDDVIITDDDRGVIDLDAGETAVVLPQSWFVSTGWTCGERGDFPLREAGEFEPRVTECWPPPWRHPRGKS